MQIPTDITARKHKNSPTSVEANKKAEPTKAVVREQIVNFGRGRNFTSKEVAEYLNKPLHAISGRCAELKALKLIEETGERRDGCSVLRVVEVGEQKKLF